MAADDRPDLDAFAEGEGRPEPFQAHRISRRAELRDGFAAGEGEDQGWTEQAAHSYEAVADGLYACPTCGAAVVRPDLHQDWHDASEVRVGFGQVLAGRGITTVALNKEGELTWYHPDGSTSSQQDQS